MSSNLKKQLLYGYLGLATVLSVAAVLFCCWAWREFGPHPAPAAVLPPSPQFKIEIAHVVIKPRQEKAVDLVWRKQFEMVAAEAPAVTWIEGDDLNCADGLGWKVDDINNSGHPGCAGGLFDSAHFTIYVAWPTGTRSYASTNLAHELAHARLFRMTSEISYSHAGYDYAPKGRVFRANVALSKAGL